MNPLPGPLVCPVTMFAPKMRSFAYVVLAAPLLFVPPLAAAAAVTSIGFEISAPAYSRTRMSGENAPAENLTLIVFVPPAMFLATYIDWESVPETTVGPTTNA